MHGTDDGRGHPVPDAGPRNSPAPRPSKEEMVAAFRRAIAENPNPSVEQIFAGINRGIAESERAGRPVSRKHRVLLYAIALVATVLLPVGTIIWRITRALTGH
jgi:hypothetical protein